ncbi:MAG: hypothetical protein ACFE0I_02415 [Elainellaceae cyanobacterium]
MSVNQKENQKIISFWVDPEKKDELKAFADACGVTLSALVRLSVEKYLEDYMA